MSPATKVKPTRRVYQPVYPASPMTIAGGVSPNVSPSPGKSIPGDERVRGDEPARTRSGGSGETEEEAKEQTTPVARDERARRRRRCVCDPKNTGRGRRIASHEEGNDRRDVVAVADRLIADRLIERETAARALDPTGNAHEKTRALMLINARNRVGGDRPRSRPESIDQPRAMRREFLARRRREAAANAPRTPGEARAATRVTQTDPRTDANAKKNARKQKQSNASVRGCRARRVRRSSTNLRSTRSRARGSRGPSVRRAHLLPSRRGRARGLGRAERPRGGWGPVLSGGGPVRRDARGVLRRRAEPWRGARRRRRAGPRRRTRPYRRAPDVRVVQAFGFAGKGASSSWGFNPKRADLFAAYAKASATRENPRRRHF